MDNIETTNTGDVAYCGVPACRATGNNQFRTPGVRDAHIRMRHPELDHWGREAAKIEPSREYIEPSREDR